MLSLIKATTSWFIATIIYAHAAVLPLANESQFKTHLDQHLFNQNQTEAKPDLVQYASTESSNSSHTSNITAVIVVEDDRGRQEVGEAVGENVGNIISGVLGGGLENVFTGSSNFVPSTAVKEEVDFVLNNIGPALEPLINYGYNRIKGYLGFGTTSTVKPEALQVTQAPEEQIILQPIVYNNGTVQYVPIYVTITKPPLQVVVTTPPPSEDTESDNRGAFDANEIEDNEIISKYPNLVNSRVDRLHL